VKEIELLKVFTKHSNAPLARYVNKDILTQESKTLLEYLLEYSLRYKKDIEDSSQLKLLLNERLSGYSLDKKNLFFSLSDSIFSAPSAASVEDIVKGWAERSAAEQVAEIAQRVATGDETLSLLDVEPIITAYRTTSGSTLYPGSGYVENDLDKLLDAVVRSGGYDWRLPDLNVMVGPLHKGDFLVVGARPEAGKTSFILSESMYLASQDKDKRPILLINNEELGSKLQLRATQAATSRTLTEMDRDRPGTRKSLQAALNGSRGLFVKDSSQPTTREIELLVDDLKPFLVVFNVLDKVKGFGKIAFNETERLRLLAQWVRELAKEKDCICIAVVQADGTAEGEKWVRQNQLYMSKTGLPGEADCIVTIGATHDPANIGHRFIHVPKNKLPGGPRSLEAERHGYAEVLFDAERCQWRSIRYK